MGEVVDRRQQLAPGEIPGCAEDHQGRVRDREALEPLGQGIGVCLHGADATVRHRVRVLVFHGYLLQGTGSNVYNARLAEALVRAGHEVHLVCQDRSPFDLDWVDARGDWEQGTLATEVRSETVRATVYRPDIGGLLPVYVADTYEGLEARPFQDLSDAELDRYLTANVEAVREVAAFARPDVALANHLVMGPAILARALGDDVPYAVKIHGSALEYTVKPHPERFLPVAREGLAGARGVLVGSRHTAESLWAAMDDPSRAGAHAPRAARRRRRGLRAACAGSGSRRRACVGRAPAGDTGVRVGLLRARPGGGGDRSRGHRSRARPAGGVRREADRLQGRGTAARGVAARIRARSRGAAGARGVRRLPDGAAAAGRRPRARRPRRRTGHTRGRGRRGARRRWRRSWTASRTRRPTAAPRLASRTPWCGRGASSTQSSPTSFPPPRRSWCRARSRRRSAWSPPRARRAGRSRSSRTTPAWPRSPPRSPRRSRPRRAGCSPSTSARTPSPSSPTHSPAGSPPRGAAGGHPRRHGARGPRALVVGRRGEGRRVRGSGRARRAAAPALTQRQFADARRCGRGSRLRRAPLWFSCSPSLASPPPAPTRRVRSPPSASPPREAPDSAFRGVGNTMLDASPRDPVSTTSASSSSRPARTRLTGDGRRREGHADRRRGDQEEVPAAVRTVAKGVWKKNGESGGIRFVTTGVDAQGAQEGQDPPAHRLDRRRQPPERDRKEEVHVRQARAALRPLLRRHVRRGGEGGRG